MQTIPANHTQLIAYIEEAFQNAPPSQSLQEQATSILQKLFAQFSFDFGNFLKTLALSKKEEKRLLIGIFYGLYYKEFEILSFKSVEISEMLWLFVADKIPRKKLAKQLSQLSQEKKIHLILAAFNNYREGSYVVLNILKEESALKHLINNLKRKYYSLKLFNTVVDQSLSLDEIISKLNLEAQEETKRVYNLLQELIPLVVNSPLDLYEQLKTAKSFDQKNEKDKANVLHNQLKKRFADYFDHPYTLEEFDLFAKIFGFEGHVSHLKFMDKDLFLDQSLELKLTMLLDIFKNPLVIVKLHEGELHSYYDFLFHILAQLNALHHHPEHYLDGLKLISCGIPTKGRDLSLEAALPSAVEALDHLIKFLNEKNRAPIAIKEIPIFIFDQSEEKLLKKNQKTIAQLNKKYKCSIISITKDEALSLADKIGIRWLIDTTGTTNFGYGGAKNCVLLLSPILRKLFNEGKSSISNILSTDAKQLKKLFESEVLFGTNPIFILDDDMEIPISNFYIHAVSATESQKKYQMYASYTYGRSTKKGLLLRKLETALNAPWELFIHTKWLDYPVIASMSEYLTKPKLCFNLPIGSEEENITITATTNMLIQCSNHLASTRFPNKEIPTKAFVGLDRFLKNFNTYSFGIGLSVDLIDSINKLERSISIWNDKTLLPTYCCLNDVLKVITDKNVIETMRKNFWCNVEEMFSPNSITFMGERIRYLSQMDVKAIVKDFKKEKELSKNEMQSLRKLEKVYLDFQKDANFLIEMAHKILHEHLYDEVYITSVYNEIENKYNVQLSDYSLTHSFYLVLLSIGAAQFNEKCKKLL